jgi:hypothetical protein
VQRLPAYCEYGPFDGCIDVDRVATRERVVAETFYRHKEYES